MATSFNIEAIIPSGIKLQTTATFLKLRTVNGDIGILANHSNLVTELGSGEMLIQKDKEEEKYYLSGGFMEVRQDKVVIMAEEVIEASLIDVERLRKETEVEEAKLEELKEEKDILSANKRIQDNLTKIRIGTR
jgi:F-type H+-transporting ATPase subunit epsilon